MACILAALEQNKPAEMNHESLIPDLVIQTDASKSWGVVPFFMAAVGVAPDWMGIGIMAKELTPIILSCAVWGKLLSWQRVLFQC